MVGGVEGVEGRALAELFADGLQKVQFASSSRVPLRKSIGTVTAPRWSARFVSGLPG